MARKTSRQPARRGAGHQQKAAREVKIEARAKEFLSHYQRRDFPAALAIAKSMTSDFPYALFGWKALGTCLMESGDPSEAIFPLQQALKIKPDDLETHTNIGKAYQKLGRFDDALEHLEKALAISPGDYHANLRISDIYKEKEQHSYAIKHLDKSIESNPDAVLSQLRKANALVETREYDQALTILEPLVKKHGNNASIHSNLANLYGTMGRFEEAEKHYITAIGLMPGHHLAFSNYFFTAHYNPAHSADDLFDIASEWRGKYAPSPRPQRPVTAKSKNKKLRIGLVSSGLRSHPVGQMITGGLENLNKHDISLYAYSDKLANDHIAKRIQGIVDSWEDVLHLSDEALADKIRHDEIDILIDMTGHTAGNRLMAMSREPAPLIIKWVGGLFNTVGLEAFDYLISDHIETPEGVDDYYLEKLVRLPDDYICYTPPDYAPSVGRLPALSNGYVTFGCFNNPAKVNEKLLEEWAKLMHRVPGSRLVLKGGQYTNTHYCESIYTILEGHDIIRERVILEGPVKHKALLEAYNRIDIALDPWPYSGGLTTCEAMLMGVPVVTMPGPTFAGRHSATHLVNAGMPELVVNSWEEYRERVLELAGDLQSLNTIRQHLREVLLQSPVCDAPRFAQHFTVAMRGIWQRYCEGKAPAALTFNKEGNACFEGESHPVEVQHPEQQKQNDDFQWKFEGKIIAIDNSGQLLRHDTVRQMLQQKTMELIAFDPASQALNNALRQQEGVHYYPNASLGDGLPGTLYACLDPVLSATLKPLGESHVPEDEAKGSQVLTQIPISTIALDKIEGLPSVDWLVLDAKNDSVAILEHGEQALKDTLLIQARVAFQPNYDCQPNLAELSHWASRHGFQFYRLNEPDYRSHLPDRDDLQQHQATELESADALFIPSHQRMESLNDNQRVKLAFILSSKFGVHDLTYQLLCQVDEEKAENYLKAQGYLASPVAKEKVSSNQELSSFQHSHEIGVVKSQEGGTIELPSAPFMSDNERALFRKQLEIANHYFEFGSGGSTVWAVEQGLTVHGVESDEKWVNALKVKLGDNCQVRAVDIGPTREWGYPVSTASRDKFPTYSRAIHEHDTAFDLILVDGRFRVACTLSAIEHILTRNQDSGKTRIFIHDFWNRPQYHAVLEFLEPLESSETAGVFLIKDNVDMDKLGRLWQEYSYQPA
ncbi:hypothetical protein GCM10007160_20170 [Litchfieldella qijiaojingensis]|uniref:protein O-GlcNAc transferase n=1 Tax=Litchfieldella qijiaojingensis TaxID=980347 RepID=A0ABQ2YUG6_9GAMM|nr:tetratricopeptide repeat protein [Halomonas qijiaojingensis]GGX92638.1 hypothetical protein GCM10007160_20170 [Halomonas qijiaojingensis]